jgi:hypothetical protein
MFMKYIKVFENFEHISELVKNTKLISSYLDDIKKMVIEINPNVRFDKELQTSTPQRFLLTISYLEESDLSELEKNITTWKKKLLEESIILSYSRNNSSPIESRIQYYVVIKDLLTKRVKPNRFLFHFTNSDTTSILSKGLIPKESSDSEKWTVPTLAYIPAIFAVNSFNARNMWGGKNIILIDTENLPNKWWYDLNFDAREPLIMTFDPIPAKYLKLIDSKEYTDMCNLYKK